MARHQSHQARCMHAHVHCDAHICLPACTCYPSAQMHILNSICGRKVDDLELAPLEDSPHYNELSSMLHARVAVAGLHGAVDRWFAGEKWRLQSHLSAIKAPGAKLRKVTIDFDGLDFDEDAANGTLLAIVQPSLVELSFTGCKSLTVLPETIGLCASLTRLDLQRCEGLTVLPEAMISCTSLAELCRHRCLPALPETISNCTWLIDKALPGLLQRPHCAARCNWPNKARHDSVRRPHSTASDVLQQPGRARNVELRRPHSTARDDWQLHQPGRPLPFRLQPACNGLTTLPRTIGNSVHLQPLQPHRARCVLLP